MLDMPSSDDRPKVPERAGSRRGLREARGAGGSRDCRDDRSRVPACPPHRPRTPCSRRCLHSSQGTRHRLRREGAVMFGGIDQLRAGRHRDAGRAIRAGLGTMLLLMLSLGPWGAVPVSADPSSPLQVTKTANPNPVTSGGLLVYTISIKNTRGAKDDTVVITDQRTD